MGETLGLAAGALTTPMVLFFALGLGAALARSDLAFPEAVAKGMSLYLLFAIGFKGGVGVAEHGADAALAAALLAGVALSALTPVAAFALLRLGTGLSRVDAAAVSAHYGSISIVTFVAMTALAESQALEPEGFMVAVAAAMEAPAIVVALLLARGGAALDRATLHEATLNGSIVLLVGAFAIGWITGPAGMAEIEPFIAPPFKGVLALFLLDMGLIAGRGLLRSAAKLTPALVAFGVAMPLIGAALGLGAGWALGLSTGGVAVLAALAASASYIAAPAAMRVALPEADPAIYVTLALGVTFPFNLTLGLPLYLAAARVLTDGG